MDRLSYERLEVWQKALAFANRIYEVTAEFPKSEVFGLVSQMRRAGVSVAANIAEGTSRSSLTEQARFAEIAYGSLCEVTTMLHLARSQNLLPADVFEQMYENAMEICRLLSGYRRSAEARARAAKKGQKPSTINHQPST